jgi:uncharacterized membrane protein
MPLLSSTAWVLHDLGLATSIGGTLFGRLAMHPALGAVSDPQERDRVAEIAWRRFSRMNLTAHGAMAVSWFIGRQLLSGEEVSEQGRALTRTKHALVAASVTTGVASAVLGRSLGRRIDSRRGPHNARETNGRLGAREAARARRLDRAVSIAGLLNLVANAGIAAVTTILAMQSGRSMRLAAASRELP